MDPKKDLKDKKVKKVVNIKKISPQEIEKNRIIRSWSGELEEAKKRVEQLEKSCARLGELCKGKEGYCDECGSCLYWWTVRHLLF